MVVDLNYISNQQGIKNGTAGSAGIIADYVF